jgi:DNA-binding LytR/AlgR family response regulator
MSSIDWHSTGMKHPAVRISHGPHDVYHHCSGDIRLPHADTAPAGEAKYVQLGESDQTQSPTDGLLVKKLGKEFLISVSDIDWSAASGNYANLHVQDRVYPMRITMNRIQELLPANQFFRIHRSSIVNLQYVAHIESQDSGDHLVTLLSGKKLGFSRRYRSILKKHLQRRR